MRTKNVKIGNDRYQLTAVTCDKSGPIALELIQNVAPILVSFIDGNVDVLNNELRTSLSPEKMMRIFVELINFDLLEINGELCNDWQGQFACKPLTLFQLGMEALRFNCEDFFTFISGFVKEKSLGVNLKETIANLKKEGVEVHPMFANLFQNTETEEVKTTKKK